MALSKEDKGDVKKAMGKALANKVSKVTRDGGAKSAKKYFYDEGVKNVGKEKTISGLKTAFKKHKPSDTYMGRPRRELDKEQGIGEFKGRYD